MGHTASPQCGFWVGRKEYLGTDEEAIPGESKCEVLPSGVSQQVFSVGVSQSPLGSGAQGGSIREWEPTCWVPGWPLPPISGVSLGKRPLCSSAKWDHGGIYLLEPLAERMNRHMSDS